MPQVSWAKQAFEQASRESKTKHQHICPLPVGGTIGGGDRELLPLTNTPLQAFQLYLSPGSFSPMLQRSQALRAPGSPPGIPPSTWIPEASNATSGTQRPCDSQVLSANLSSLMLCLIFIFTREICMSPLPSLITREGGGSLERMPSNPGE